jgi:4-amino-4-deoxy-L-arabinose transferase-like glycosyltransferase
MRDLSLVYALIMPRFSKTSLVWLFALALIPRLLYLASIPQDAILESIDAKGYDLLARNLRAGHGFSLQDTSPYQPTALRTPLYPLFLSVSYWATGEHAIVVALVQAILDSLTTLLVGAIASDLMGRRAGIVAAALYALTPVQWRYSAALLAEIPLAFLTTAGMWLFVRVAQSTRTVFHRRQTIACGIIAGLAALCKPNLAGLALILAISAFWAPQMKRQIAVIIAVSATFTVSPWLIRNWIVFERPFLSNALLGYVARVTAPATIGIVEGHRVPPWSSAWETRYHTIVSQAATRFGWDLSAPTPLSPPQTDQRERQIAQVAMEVVRAQPWDAMQAHFIGFLRSWAPQEQTFWYTHLSHRPWEGTGVAANALRDATEIFCDSRPFEAFESAFIKPWEQLDPFGRALWYGWGLGHLLAGWLAALGLWRLRRWPAPAIALAAIILYATLPPGPIGYVRFRVPVVPLITVLETSGLAWLHSRLAPSLVSQR